MTKNYKMLFVLLAVGCVLAACSKKNSAKPTNKSLAAVAAKWTIASWGGEEANPLNFTIDANTATGTITTAPPISFNYAAGDKLFTDITANADGTYSAKGKFTYGPNNVSVSVRNITLSLQNNGKQLTAFYPAMGPDFPAITYIFQQGTTDIAIL